MLGLPPGLIRLLAGKPVVVDGQTLDPETQWMLRLEKLTGEAAAETLPIEEARRAILRQSAIVGGRQPSVGAVQALDDGSCTAAG